jgi:hypothetical protein
MLEVSFLPLDADQAEHGERADMPGESQRWLARGYGRAMQANIQVNEDGNRLLNPSSACSAS